MLAKSFAIQHHSLLKLNKGYDMQATIIINATTANNHKVFQVATLAQDLQSSPFYQGSCNLPYVPYYYGHDDHCNGQTLNINNFFYATEKGNLVSFKKIKKLNKVYWEINLDCTRGWLCNHQLGVLVNDLFSNIPQIVVKLKSQQKERGVWDKQQKQGRFQFKNGFLHLKTNKNGVVIDPCWKALLRKNNCSVKAAVVY